MDFLSRRARAIVPYVAGEQPGDRRYVKLNTNENPYPPSPRALAAYQNCDFSSLKLYPPLAMGELRAAIAAAEGVEPENIFCGNGSDEVLALCFPAFFDEGGDGAAFADVTYSFYPVFCSFFGVPFTEVPLEADFTQDLAKLTAAKAQGLLVANPNAPTGIGIPLAEIERFVAANAGRVVILDEAYMPFFGQSAAPLTQKYENLLVVKTFSKGYSLAGMRCGYAVGSRALLEGLERAAYYADTTARVVSERARLTRALEGLGFTVLPSCANFLFARHAERGGQEIYAALRARGVLVRHFQKPRIADYNRITVGTPAENDALLAALRDFLGA